jgi:hypothetical protein
MGGATLKNIGEQTFGRQNIFPLFGKDNPLRPRTPPPPPVPPVPPVPSLPSIPGSPDPSSTDVTGVVDRAARKASQQARTGGRLSTILTSPLGLTEPATTSRRILLGR